MNIDLGYPRSAKVVWQGPLDDGQGEVTVESGAIGTQVVSFYARVNHPKRGQQTTPEELLAAACATDLAMVLSALLTEAEHPPTRITIDATCVLERLIEGGFKLAALKLDVKGLVPGFDEQQFQGFFSEANKGCPLLNALRQGIEIGLEAKLEGE